MERPLEGIRVIECAIFHAGPGAAAILGDLGAEVIKIEEPGTGDPIRNMMQIGSIPFEIKGRSIFYEGANRNKKSISVDITTEKGHEILSRLVKTADVFLTNFRRPAIESMKITYSILRKINPKLIYASISAFGPKGPDRDKGGFDYQGQARSGLMYSFGEEGMIPLVCQFGVMDQITAIITSNQIITALFMRERRGIGQEVKVSILGSSMFTLYFNTLISSIAGFEIPRHTRSVEHPMRNYYMGSDKRWIMMTLTPPERHWGPLCNVLERSDLINDPRFDSDEKRFKNAKQLVAIFDKIFATRPRDEWLRLFGEYDLFACAVNTPGEVSNDPQAIENDYIIDLDHPVFGKIKFPGYPASFSESSTNTISPAPELGEHTDDVLSEIGGYTKEEIAKLRDEGVI